MASDYASRTLFSRLILTRTEVLRFSQPEELANLDMIVGKVIHGHETRERNSVPVRDAPQGIALRNYHVQGIG